MTIFSIIGLASLIAGFLSGLVGIGGGIIMAPILIFLPVWVGLGPLEMKVIAGLTIMQGLLGCMFGAFYHKQFNFVSGELFKRMGVPIFIASFIGGLLSRFVSNTFLLVIFASLALLASFLIFIPVKGDSENPDVAQLDFKKFRALLASSSVGLLGGLVGQGGSFILIPLMTSYVHIPTRIAIGSNLAIIMMASAAGFLGKAVSGQIEWMLTIPLLLSVIPATFIGSLASRSVSIVWLKRILALVIAFAALRIWYSILWG